MPKILVTGSNSGLGCFCCEFFNATPFNRQTKLADILASAEERPFDAIIHSAFNTRFDVKDSELYGYLNDTLLLTQKLLQIPYKKFIFISTSDVYPNNQKPQSETNEINIKDLQSIYPISKLLTESMVRNESNNHLILRPTAMLGMHAKPNSLIRILTQQNPSLTLAELSSFNYIRHADVARFIELALAKDLTGIYNLAAAANITLADVAQYFMRQVTFGKFTYTTGQVMNAKAAALLERFNNTSLENIKLFLQESGLPFTVSV